MTYDDRHHHDDPSTGSATGFAAIKYTAIVIIVVAIIAFLVWAANRLVF